MVIVTPSRAPEGARPPPALDELSQTSLSHRHCSAPSYWGWRASDGLWPNGNFRSSFFGHRNTRETKTLLFEPRQHTAASPKPEREEKHFIITATTLTQGQSELYTQKWQVCVCVCACAGTMQSSPRFQLHTPVFQWFAVKGSTPAGFLVSSPIWNQTASPQRLKTYHNIISTQISIQAYLKMIFEKVGIKFYLEVPVKNYAYALRSYRNTSYLYNLLMLLLKWTLSCFSSATREEQFLLSADTSGIPVM